MEYKAEITYNSKRAMATAALFTDVFAKYLDRHKCEKISHSEELEQFSSEILDHVIIVGGFCRDILLNKSINDIDIVINLRELCKLQTNHLKKYHSKKEDQNRSLRCVYWQRYLERFNESAENVNEQQKHNKEMIAMHNINYIFNISFWISILRTGELLDNKLSVKDVAKGGYASCQIVNTVKYGGINLDQQCIDFIDTFSLEKCYNSTADDTHIIDFKTFHRKSRQLSMSGININIDRADIKKKEKEKETLGGADDDVSDYDSDDDDETLANKSRPEQHKAKERKLKDNHGRLKSMAVIEFDIDELGGDFGSFSGFKKEQEPEKEKEESEIKSRPEYIAIEVPIYSGKVRYKLLNYDFSINTSILPLSNIIKLKEYNNEYNHSNNENTHSDPMTWIEIIENGLGECDAIQDCQINKILRTPEPSHEHCSIEAHPITYLFWRIIRWLIRDNTFKIDQNLIIAQIKDYQNWLNSQWFDIEKNCNKFMKYLCKTIEKECKSMADIKQMLNTMEILQFNQRFVQLLHDSQNIRHALIDSVGAVRNDNLQNSAIIDAFKQYKYPIEQQLFKIPSQTEEELQKIIVRKEFLQQEMEKKDQRIRDLEKQNDTLLKEVQYLQQLNQNNSRISNLETQNSELLTQLQNINESKVKLAINANQTIDQLRKFLIEYQQIAMEKN